MQGVFTAAFEIATECACSVQRAETLLTSGSKNRKAPNRGYYGQSLQRASNCRLSRFYNLEMFADMSKTIDSSEDEILPPLRTRDPYSTSRARMKPKQRVKSKSSKKKAGEAKAEAADPPSLATRGRGKGKGKQQKQHQQHPAEVVPLSERDMDRGRVRLGGHGHDHHLDRDEVTCCACS